MEDPIRFVTTHATFLEAKEWLYRAVGGGLYIYGRKERVENGVPGLRWYFQCKGKATCGCGAKGWVTKRGVDATLDDGTVTTVTFAAGGLGLHIHACPRNGTMRGLFADDEAVARAVPVVDGQIPTTRRMADRIVEEHVVAMLPAVIDNTQVPADIDNINNVLPTRIQPPSLRSIRHVRQSMGVVNPVHPVTADEIIAKYFEMRDAVLLSQGGNPGPVFVRVVGVREWVSDNPLSNKKPKVNADVPPDANHDIDPRNSVFGKIIVLSSDELMRSMAHPARRHWVTDATYKVAPRQAAVATLGFFDGRAYVPVFFSLNTGSKSGDTMEHWIHFFQCIRDVLAVVNANSFSLPNSIMRDHATCISSAISAVYPGVDQRVCYFHVRQCVRNQRRSIPSLQNDDMYKFVCEIIDALHFCRSEAEFMTAVDLASHCLPRDFSDYFFKKTAHAPGAVNGRWSFAYIAPGEAVTGSAIESFHAHLRKEHFAGLSHPDWITCLCSLAKVARTYTTRLVSSAAGTLEGITRSFFTTERRTTDMFWRQGIKMANAGVVTRTYYNAGLQQWSFLASKGSITRDEIVERIKKWNDAPLHSRKKGRAWLNVCLIRLCTLETCSCPTCSRHNICKHLCCVRYHVLGPEGIPPEFRSALPLLGDATDVESPVSEKESSSSSDDEDDGVLYVPTQHGMVTRSQSSFAV